MPPERVSNRPNEAPLSGDSRAEQRVENVEARISRFQKGMKEVPEGLLVVDEQAREKTVRPVIAYGQYSFFMDRGELRALREDKDGAEYMDMAKLDPTFRVAASAMLTGRTSAPVSPERPQMSTERPRLPERRETLVDETPESVLRALGEIRIESGRSMLGIKLPDARSLASTLRKNNVPPERFPQFVQNMREHAALLSNAISQRPAFHDWQGEIGFAGEHLTAESGGERLITMANRVLVESGGRITTFDGKAATFTDNPTSKEVRIGDLREISRGDAGLQMTEQRGTIRYFDGNNSRPVMERVNGEVFIIGPNGQRVGMRPRGSVRSPQDAIAWGREIAGNLRTPEAIGAFISQFQHGQDYKGAGRQEQQDWVKNVTLRGNPVQYVAESGGQQNIQNWQTTLMLRTGDCEDFALLAQGLLELAGIPSFVMLVSPDHFEAVYFEVAPGGGYRVCAVGLRGFNRSTQVFPSLGEAARSLWNKQTTNATSGARYVSDAQSDGIFVQGQNGTDDSGIVDYSNEAYFRQFVR